MKLDIIEMITEKAMSGEVQAQIFLSFCYAKGRWGAERNYDEAEKWAEKVAEQYKKLADEGDAKAMRFLAESYSIGMGVKLDLSEERRLDKLAFDKFKSLAEAGDPDAQYEYSRYFLPGYEWDADDAERVKWLRLACESGHAKAQLELAYRLGYERYPDGSIYAIDNDEANEWYILAASNFRADAEKGDAEAKYFLGCCYKEGHGVVCDFVEALKWFTAAAEGGYYWAYENIASVEKLEEYRKGVLADDGEACYQLARCYYYGIDVKQDQGEAMALYEKAADMGHEDSVEMLKRIKKSFLTYKGASKLSELGDYLENCGKSGDAPDLEIVKNLANRLVTEREDTHSLLGIFTRDFKDCKWAAEAFEAALLSVGEKDIYTRGDYPTAADEAKKTLFHLYYNGEFSHEELGTISFPTLENLCKAAGLLKTPYFYDDEYMGSVYDIKEDEKAVRLFEEGRAIYPEFGSVAANLLKKYARLRKLGKDTLAKMLEMINAADYECAYFIRDMLEFEIEGIAESIPPKETEQILSAINDRCFELGVRSTELPLMQLSFYQYGYYNPVHGFPIKLHTLQNIEKALAFAKKYGLSILVDGELIM